MSVSRGVRMVSFLVWAVPMMLAGEALQAQQPVPARPARPPAPPADARVALANAAKAVEAKDLGRARDLLLAAAAPGSVEIESHRLFLLGVVDQLAAEEPGAEASVLLARAAESYSRAVESDPGSVGALHNLGRVYERLGEIDRAGRAYRLAASQPGPGRLYHLRALADFLAAHERWPEAEEVYEQLVLLEPRSEEPHRILSARLLARPKESERLFDYLWKLIAAGQLARAENLALDALEGGWPEWSQPELLTVVAAGLGGSSLAPAELASSAVGRRVAGLATGSPVAEGARELLALYGAPAGLPAGSFRWWDRQDLEWAEQRGVARRDAIRSVLRAVAAWYREHGAPESAAACYRAAVDASASPDPVALRELAGVYVEQGDLGALDSLAARYADPRGALFVAKNEAYRRGQLETVLQYHRTLGQIYGNLARNGRTGWGDTATPSTALFQLRRAYDVAATLDDQGPHADGVAASHVDPALAVLLAEGYHAQRNDAAGNDVRLDAAARFTRAGDARARDLVLKGVATEALTPAQQDRFQRYRIESTVPPKTVEPPATTPAKPSRGLDTAVALDAGKWQAAVAEVVVPRRGEDAKRMDFEHDPRLSAARAIEIRADAGWVDTSVPVRAGQKLTIRASGRWSNAGAPQVGPEGFVGFLYPGTEVKDAALASLVGRIGDATFAVGAGRVLAAPASGRLLLSINDTPGTFGDNQGAVKVEIVVE